jgi:hypothetical protein
MLYMGQSNLYESEASGIAGFRTLNLLTTPVRTREGDDEGTVGGDREGARR